MTQAPLTFFRVFDLAFFAPGTVLGVSLYAAGARPEGFLEVSLVEGVELTTTRGIFALLGGIALVYVAGMVIHGLTFTILRRQYLKFSQVGCIKWLTKPPADSMSGPPLPLVFADPTRTDLVLYFWYQRATCWNIATALGLSFVVSLVCTFRTPANPAHPGWILLSLYLLSSIVLVLLGNGYHRAFFESRKSFLQEKGALP